MAGNRPARERFEFSLDARQVAGVILGSLGALALAFFLGNALGKRVADRPAPAAPVAAAAKPADPLAALDQPPRADGGEPDPRLSYHEALTASRPPPEHLPPAPKPQPIPAPVPEAKAPAAKPAAPPQVAAAPSASAPATASPPVAATPGAAAPAVAAEARAAPQAKAAPPPVKPAAAPEKAAAKPAPAAPKAAPGKGAFVVQVGSTQDRFEAERIAARFASRGPRVTAADVPGKGRWFRVRLGSFETREAADRYLRDLERTTGAKGFVTTAN